MPELHHIFAMQKKMFFFLLALCALGWGFTPYQSIFAGLAVGAFFGTYNFWILVRKMDKFDKSISEGKRVASLGSALRFGSGIAAVAFAITWPEDFHLVSSVIGLMIPYVILLVGSIVSSVRNN